MQEIRAISPLDGRYSSKIDELRDIFSEHGLIKNRFLTEIYWLEFILKDLKLEKIDENDFKKIDTLKKSFSEKSTQRVKEIESTTNHDVKALEYYIKEELDALDLGAIKEWVHFSCTSEDINNCAYALMLKEGQALLEELGASLLTNLESKAQLFKSIPMMARTHGQPASPTTLGKEFVNFSWRVKKELKNLKNIKIMAKMNGATGNYNAHHFVFPKIDWINASRKFISESLNVEPLIYTTQINSNHYISELLHSLARLSSIIIDLDRDMWGYISIGYFKQKLKEGEIGSSTMPHKVNPIDFENSEGNMGVAIPLMEHLAVKLQNSRFQRDLTDSTVLRNLGSILGYVFLGIKSTLKGLNKLDLNEQRLQEDLNNNLELLAEPIQSLMRVYKEDNPYEKLKMLTRGVKISQQSLNDFIDTLETVPDAGKQRMKALTPFNYIGLAEKIVDEYFDENK